jgi:7-cyano-7-deazaguanine synthase
MKPGVLVASGGIDSTVLMYELVRKKKLKGVIFFDYGQASVDQQLKCLRWQTPATVRIEVVRLQLPAWMRGSGAIMKGTPKKKQKSAYESMKLNEKELKTWMKDVWDYIPGRNTLFILYALAYARSLKVNTVYVGFQHDEPEWQMFLKQRDFSSAGMDTTPGYVDAFNFFITQGAMDADLRIEAPWFDKQMDKAAIIARGQKLGVDLSETYSCEFFPPCGGCRGCLVRNELLTSQEENVG